MRQTSKGGGTARNGWGFVVVRRIAWEVLLASVAATGAAAQAAPCDATRWAGVPTISGSLTINAHASASGSDGSSLTLNETINTAPEMSAPPGGIPCGWSGPMNANVTYTMVSTDSLG